MTLATLSWNRVTTTFALAGATPTLAEFLTKISNFITASSTYWKVTGSDLTGAGVANAGYVELAPKSATVGITGMRVLIAYTDAGTAVNMAAANRIAPYTGVTGSACRIWVGGSPNAATTGPDANPWVSKAYTTAGWGGMMAVTSGGIIIPNNGGELGIIESNESICIYFYNGANSISVFMFGNLIEAPDGNSASFVMTNTGTPISSTPGSYSTGWLFARIYNNSSIGATSNPKGITVDNASGLQSANMSWETTGNIDGTAFTSGTNAYLQAVLASGGAWGGGDLDVGRGIWRQIRRGPKAFNGQVMTDGTTKQATALNWHASVPTVGAVWFDEQR